MLRPLSTVLGLCLSLAVLPLHGQDPGPADTTTVPVPEPDPADVSSIDAIMKTVYEVISGPADQERDWDRFLSLFVPDARLIPAAVMPDGEFVVRAISPAEYAERAAIFFRQPGGFFEREIGRKTDVYGDIAHVLSAYESLREGEEEPFMRGVNSFQLANLGDRWAIVTILWQQETPEAPIPPELLFDDSSNKPRQ